MRRRPSATRQRGPIRSSSTCGASSTRPGCWPRPYDDIERAEAHCYLGLEALEEGRNDAAIAHFRWVKERGNRRSMQYALSVAELDRLLAEGAEGDGP